MNPSQPTPKKTCLFLSPDFETQQSNLGQPPIRIRRDLSAFSGFPCQHYRELPNNVLGNSACKACANRFTCAANERRLYGASSATSKVGPQKPDADRRGDHDQPAVDGLGEVDPSRRSETAATEGQAEVQTFLPDLRPAGRWVTEDLPLPPTTEMVHYRIASAALEVPLPQNPPGGPPEVDDPMEDGTMQPPLRLTRERGIDDGSGAGDGTAGGGPPPTTTGQLLPSTGTAPTRSLPVLDSQGNLQAGVVAGELPRIECNSCYLSEECPKYRADSPCSFNAFEDQFDTSTPEGALAFAEFLLTVDKTRIFRAILVERMTTGGLMDPRISQGMDRMRNAIGSTVRLKAELKALQNPPPLHTDHHTVTLTETRSSQPALPGQAPQEPNILMTLMRGIAGGKGSRTEEPAEILEVEAKEVKKT